MDDKGPAFAALYAMKAVTECGLPMRRRVRLIFGCNEETGMRCIQHYYENAEAPTLAFSPGWNLVSVPLGIAYTAEEFGDAINAQGGSCVEIDRWYAGGWDSHIINLPFNNFAIAPASGYFVRCTAASTMTITVP